jgi:coenzyme F420 hydrogenase subunit beta
LIVHLSHEIKKRILFKPKSFIARTTDEVKEASGSKYCPVPANIAIKELSERAGKIATVGLPCHIHGIRKAEEINEGLKDKISLHFGLFCSRGVNFSGTEFWLDKLRVRKENIENIAYRSKGWPGGTLVELEGNSKFIPQSKFWNIFSLFFFVNMRCLFCSDQTSELADVSFGDAWLPRFEGNKLGWSVIISRTEIGEQILRKAAENNVIKLEAINAREVIRSQLSSLYFKKRNLKARENMFRKKLSDNSAAFHPHFGDYCLALFSFLNSYLSTKPFSKSILKHIPLAGLAAYGWSFSLLLKKILRDFEKCY